jgi:hypothetical protein
VDVAPRATRRREESAETPALADAAAAIEVVVARRRGARCRRRDECDSSVGRATDTSTLDG